MALTQTAEYALRAVVWLAQHPNEPQTKTQIAQATQVPSSYLPKVFQPLVRGGLIHAQRGIGGGYTLAKESAEITLLDVVNEVDPIQPIDRCPLSLASHGTKLCPLHSLLNRVILEEQRLLGRTKVSDVTRGEGQPTPLCEFVALAQKAAAADESKPSGAA
ncbi:HTH-type transcriptional regulator IscR [Planctomycetes bacterium Poly30]|uniref:HTH-type transcriptional regulator IscR n=1 Tax=Saltatorellus ferox TaxID=2528018 RepID=A0A518F142_9BACT|nr:HTH-type transcriptional regulator IscR [Planctomycetes bacterium Poly30]